MDNPYSVVRKHDREAYDRIVAFSSMFAQESPEFDSGLAARVEYFLMQEVAGQIEKKLAAIREAEIRTIQAQRKFDQSICNKS